MGPPLSDQNLAINKFVGSVRAGLAFESRPTVLEIKKFFAPSYFPFYSAAPRFRRVRILRELSGFFCRPDW
jgi:hypothetical protein